MKCSSTIACACALFLTTAGHALADDCPMHMMQGQQQATGQHKSGGKDMAVVATTETGLKIIDPYARSASPVARTGAAFLVVANPSDAPDRLIDARSDAAKKVELHTHVDLGDGRMQMRDVPEGFEVPAHGCLVLERGGRHVMMMGLAEPWKDGDAIEITLVFEKAGEVTIEVPVDLDREPAGHSH